MERYWVYAHDLDGELTEDIIETDDLEIALDHTVDYLHTDCVVRIVDHHDKFDGQTIWIAGPMSYIRENVDGLRRS